MNYLVLTTLKDVKTSKSCASKKSTSFLIEAYKTP